MAIERRRLKTVTGVSSSPDVYAAALDPTRSTLDEAARIARPGRR